MEKLKKYFPKNTSDWKIVHSRTFYNTDILGELDRNFAQITMRYKTEDHKYKYMVFERQCSQNLTYFSWRIFIVDYNYYI